MRNIVVRDVRLLEARTVGRFFTLADFTVEKLTLSNITILSRGQGPMAWTAGRAKRGAQGMASRSGGACTRAPQRGRYHHHSINRVGACSAVQIFLEVNDIILSGDVSLANMAREASIL